MARRRRPRTDSALSDVGELNLTPLLDVIFNLIFFFLLATTLKVKANFYELQLPESSQAPSSETEEVTPEVTVLADGTLMLNGVVMKGDEIMASLKRQVEDSGLTEAILSAEGEATMNQTITATDLLYEAGIREMMQRVDKKPITN
jgi:biopolymer transport protein ExbD